LGRTDFEAAPVKKFLKGSASAGLHKMYIQLIRIGQNQEEKFMRTIKSRFYSVFFAGAAVFTALILAACTFALDPVNALTDAFRFADTNVGTLRVVNEAKNGAVLYAIQVINPDNSLREYWFESGLLSGVAKEYTLPAGINYRVKFNNGQGWTKTAQSAFFIKDDKATLIFSGTEEISIDLAGVKGKLTVYNLIPGDTGEYVIQNLRVSSTEGTGTDERDSVIFYFYTDGIRNGKDAKRDFDILPGDYWVRAQIRHPNGKLSKWSIPAHVGTYSSSTQTDPTVSDTPSKVTVSADKIGIAIFNAGVLKGGAAGADVDIGEGRTDFPSIPDNSLLDEDGNEIPNVTGTISPDSSPVQAIKVEKLGFPTANKDGVTNDPKYTYAQKNEVLDALSNADAPDVTEDKKARIVRTTIYDQDVSPGGTWQLGLSEPGWYLLSFSVDGKNFSKGYPIRLEDKNGNGKIDPDEVEPKPGDIPPFDNDSSTWIEKQGVIVTNETPEDGGTIIGKDGSTIGTLSPEDAKKPITDIKIYNSDGTLYAHYKDRRGLPIYNGVEWIVNPTLDPGDYLVTFSDDYGKTWTYPPIPLHVDGNGNGSISYDKTHPQWDGTTAGKPGPETTSPDLWGDDTDEKNEVNSKTPIYVVVPSDPPLDTVPPAGTPPGSEGPKELVNATGDANNDTTPSAYGSQLDIVNRSTRTPSPFVIKYIKLNASSTPRVAYRIIDLTKITYSGGGGGIPVGKRLSLVGFDLKPDTYWVYLSEDGKDWKRYTKTVSIPAPWMEKDGGIVFTGTVGSTAKVPKVIYKDADDQTEWDNNPPPPTGILLVHNSSGNPITNLSIKKADGSFLTLDGVTYNDQQPFSLANGASKLIELPVTAADEAYIIGVKGTGQFVYYRVTIEKGGITYLFFKGGLEDGKGTDTDPIPLDPGTEPGGNGTEPGGSETSGPTGILAVRNFSANPITGLTIKTTDGSFLTQDGVTYNDQYTVNIPNGGNEYFTIPVTNSDTPYIVGIKGTLTGPTQTGQRYVYYNVTIKQGKITFLSFYGNELEDSSGKGNDETDPIVLDPDSSPGNGDVPSDPGTSDPGTSNPGTSDPATPTGILVVRNSSTDQAITKLTIKTGTSFLAHGGVTYNGDQAINIPIGGNETFMIPVTTAGQPYIVTIDDTAGTARGPVYYQVTILQNKATYLTFYGNELENANGKGKTETDPVVLDPDSSPGNGVEPGAPSVDTGILVVRNYSSNQAVTKLTIKKADGSFLVHNGVTYNGQQVVNILKGANQPFILPVTLDEQAYIVGIEDTAKDTASSETGFVYYRVTILKNKLTYLTFYGTEVDEGKGKTEGDPIDLDPDSYPGDGSDPAEPPDPPTTDPTDPPTTDPPDPPTTDPPVKTSILQVQNTTDFSLKSITIKHPYSNGSVLEYAGVRYEDYTLNVPGKSEGIKYEAFVLPVTTEDVDLSAYVDHQTANEASSYKVTVVGYTDNTNTSTTERNYQVAIALGKTTYIAFTEMAEGSKLNPFEAPGNAPYVEPGDPTPPPPPDGTKPPDSDNDVTVIKGSNDGGPMQPNDTTPAFDATNPNGIFDRSYISTGDRKYPSGMVQPYLPNAPVSVLPGPDQGLFPAGGDGTKQNMGGRGYFNFRFHWPADTNWGIGYLAIQKLQRTGTSSTKTPTGPVIVLLDAKADTEAERISGIGQRRLGNIYSDRLPTDKFIDSQGSVKGENRSFDDWQRNWLGLRDLTTGWQLNVRADGTLDPWQPVYRSGKGYYPTAGRDVAWDTDKKDDAAHREYSAHRAVNNPGRLYTTGVKTGSETGLYAALGTGFEAGEYRVYLYKGYDSLYDNDKASGHNDSVRQKKMYRYYEDKFDITIYPGVVTTAVYRAGLETSAIDGAFSYTPIPQAAFGKLVVLNNPTSTNYTVDAILLDKPGYHSIVNTSSVHEVHRYLAALSTSASSMTGGIPNLLNGNTWGTMNPLTKGQMHTFILPPGGYRIAVGRAGPSLNTWYGKSSGYWLPVVVGEGETVYLTFTGDKLSR
jgi:hypothetical protein